MPTLSDIDKQIADLEAQKKQLVADEKKKALAAAHAAVKALNALGYSYTLTEGNSATPRRTGIRKEVLDVIQAAKDGISRSDLLVKLEASTKQAKQSVSNAVQALKKAGHIESGGGVYKSK